MIDSITEEQLATLRERGGDLMSAVKYIVIHCSATRSNQTYTAEQLERDHKARGFRTVGYHFYIRRDGTLTQHRQLLEPGAHCRPYNRCSIGICYEGGLDPQGRPRDTRTFEQIVVLNDLLAELTVLFPEAEVRGHRDMPGATPKDCPCYDAGAEWERRVIGDREED